MQEAAKRLHISVVTLRRWIKAGKIGSYRPHYFCILVPLAEIVKYEAQQSTKGVAS